MKFIYPFSNSKTIVAEVINVKFVKKNADSEITLEKQNVTALGLGWSILQAFETTILHLFNFMFKDF